MNSRAHYPPHVAKCRKYMSKPQLTHLTWLVWGWENMIIWCFCLVEHPTVWRTSLTSSVLEVPPTMYSALQIPALACSIEKDFNSTKTKHIENNECVANHDHSEQNHGQSKKWSIYNTCFTVSPPKTIRHPRRCSNLCASLCLIQTINMLQKNTPINRIYTIFLQTKFAAGALDARGGTSQILPMFSGYPQKIFMHLPSL